MARFSRIEVALTMQETGMVPVFYHADPKTAQKVLSACYKAGLRVFEFTNRDDFAHEVFNELTRYARKELPDMKMGIGSVIDPGTTALYLQLGADFIVSPSLNEEMAKICNRRKVMWIPGCSTASEISKAEELGAEIVKIFPAAQVGGPAFVKAIKGPCPWTSVMPTGGISPDEENLKSWFNAGATCVGMSSKLIPKNWVEAGDYDKIEGKINETLKLVQLLKKK
jgi:2-dehydro-3-deoxyphosphogluconate aldolase / (4S)-4-hydroxy-2-oxoglutarate aldolase